MAQDPRVDRLISQAPEFARPILEYLRALVHQECPEVVEEIKWGRSVFLLEGKLAFAMVAFSTHCGLGFWDPRMQEILARDGITEKEGAGSFGRIRQMDDLPPRDVLIGYIREAQRLSKDRPKAPVQKKAAPKAEILLHPDFAKAMKKDKVAADQLQKLSPSHRREYLEWIASAKRPETREKRISSALLLLKEGKPLHWKYQ